MIFPASNVRRLGAGTILLAAALTLSACSAIKYAIHLAGPPTEHAAYVPPQTPMVVLVKDPPDPMGTDLESEELAGMIEEQLNEFKIAPVISFGKVADLRTRRLSDFNTMTPAEIGQAVGASQILYVRILSSHLDSHGTDDMAKGAISTMVSMVDAADNKTLWPDDGSEGKSIGYETPLLRFTDRNTVSTIQRELHAGMAELIVRQFRSYKPDK